MKCLKTAALCLSFATPVGGAFAQEAAPQTQPTNQDTSGKAAAYAALGLEAAKSFEGYASLCNLDARMRNVNLPRKPRPQNAQAQSDRKNPERTGGRTREVSEPIGPVQVFDNLYFLGTGSVSSWLYGSEEGYILIDGLNTDEEAQKYIFDGMAQLGLDPKAITHILVTHAHGDHYGGADYVAQKLGLEVTMSAPDWDLAETLGVHPRFGPPPEKGRVVVDGDILKAGEARLSIYVTPGHTPGTISPVFELLDKGVSHMAMLWGGTGFNFGPNVQIFETYAESAQRMRDVALQENVGVYLSNHLGRDGSASLLRALSAGDQNARQGYMRGKEGLALFSVLENCALAQAERFSE